MNYAYVTLLSTNSYYKGVLVLFESLKRTNPKITNFVVVVNETIDKEIIDDLNKRGYKTILKNRIDASFVKNTIYKNWLYTFDKFNIFDLTEYDKIVYLDSDMYICKNIDELFDMPDLSATMAGSTYYKENNSINSGLMVVVPRKGISDGLKELLFTKKYTVGVGDQNIIEDYFHWRDKNLVISESYNMFAFIIDYYYRHYGYNRSMIYVVHYIGVEKPWLLTEEEIQKHKDELKEKNNLEELYFFEEYMKLLKEVE